MARLTLFRVALRSVAANWLASAATVAGVSAGVAAIAGSLLVGHSARASLRSLALDRLAGADTALLSLTPFRESIAEEFAEPNDDMPRATMLTRECVARRAFEGDGAPAVSGVSLLGVSDSFWRLARRVPITISEREAVLNEPLAADLGAAIGDALIVTLRSRSSAPVDSFLGRRSRGETEQSLRVTIVGIIPARGAGRFSLSRNDASPRNVYVDRAWLQRALGLEGRADCILFGQGAREATASGMAARLAPRMRIEDYGLHMAHLMPEPCSGGAWTVFRSAHVVMSDRVAGAVLSAAESLGLSSGRASVCLARSVRLAHAPPVLPYSVVMGLDEALFSGMLGAAAPLEGQCLLSNWAEEDLGAKIGAAARLSCLVAAPSGSVREVDASLKVAGVTDVARLASLRSLVPDVEGVTAARSLRDWRPPFPFDADAIRPKDEDFWRKYGPAPKILASIDFVKRIWTTDSQAIAAARPWITAVAVSWSADEQALRQAILSRLRPEDAGLRFRALRQEALAAAQPPSDYAVLFLSMSSFVVAGSSLLVAMLVRLAMQRRASQAGVLLCLGFTREAVTKLMRMEGWLLCLVGAILGGGLRWGYCRLLVSALQGRWSGAVAGFPIEAVFSPWPALKGVVAGFAVAACSVALASRSMWRRDAVSLLAGWRALEQPPGRAFGRRAWLMCALLFAVALGFLGFAAAGAPAEAVFFGAGAALLGAGVAALCGCVAHAAVWETGWRGPSYQSLIVRDATRGWARNVFFAAITACATFVIAAVAASREDPSRLDPRSPAGGSGGFTLAASAGLPLFADLGTEDGRRLLGFNEKDSALLRSCDVVSFRVHDGDEASCLNIQKPVSPRVIGASAAFLRQAGFSFAAVEGERRGSPWLRLEGPPGDAADAPAFAGAASARWVLHKGLGGL
ncbi:MAG TPA: ABC transporter permease, partial [Candidatus Brocadiia bacterium]|nr:ABC transporter permease [Candidatus Brocadiia bacterium]